MNPFDDVIRAMGVEGSLYVRMQFGAPWGVAFDTGYQARILVIARGTCWLTAEGMNPIPLNANDGLIVKAGTEFSMSDAIDRPWVPCSTVFNKIDGRTVRHGGNGSTVEIVSARLSFDPTAGEPLMALLPSLIHVRLDDAEANLLQTTLHLIGMETSEDGLGAGLVIGRLTDVLFVQTIRTWFAAEGEPVSGWLAGLKNRRLAAAIKAMHSDITHPWTVDQLARKAGLSRSGFAAAFKSIIGESPLGYLTNWRIYRAKALLRQGYGLAEVATNVGYESDTALSRAFKRLEGVSPGSWRANMPSMDRPSAP
jgi:AraC-like DNA-binding protein